MKQSKEEYGNVNNGSISFKIGNEVELEAVSASKMMEQYEVQYDANHDFAIFGTTQGGVQTLAEKMNLADRIEGEDLSTNKASGSNPGSGSSGEIAENREIHEL